jgi:transcription factor STE12
MYSNSHAHAGMPPPQSRSVAPETFLLDQDAQQSLPPDSIVALQQVDNRTSLHNTPNSSRSGLEGALMGSADAAAVKYFLISAPVDWQQDQYIRRFLLPTGEYVSCVLW